MNEAKNWYLPMRPPEEMTPPDYLLGHNGLLRAPLSTLKLRCTNDLEAAEQFLGQLADHGHRGESRGAIRRLFLWAWIVRNKPVSSLLHEDLVEYGRFCADPQPAELWVGNAPPKYRDLWRPFGETQNLRSIYNSVTGLNTFFNFLVSNGYLLGNPIAKAFPLHSVIRPRVRISEPVRALFDDVMWKAVAQAVEERPAPSKVAITVKERARFLILLILHVSPCMAEASRARMNTFRLEAGTWWWKPDHQGKAKGRAVPVCDELLEALARYRAFLNLPPTPDDSEDDPLFVSGVAGNPGLTPKSCGTTLSYDIRRTVALAVEFLPPEYAQRAPVLRTATFASIRSYALRVHTRQRTD